MNSLRWSHIRAHPHIQAKCSKYLLWAPAVEWRLVSSIHRYSVEQAVRSWVRFTRVNSTLCNHSIRVPIRLFLLQNCYSREITSLITTILVSLSPTSTDIYPTRLHNIPLLPPLIVISNSLHWVDLGSCIWWAINKF